VKREVNMPISRKLKQQLYKEGFLPREIVELQGARGGDVRTGHRVKQEFNTGSKVFKSLRRARVKYITDLRQAGWSGDEIRQKINEYYRLKTGRSVYDFLKLSYQPARKITDFQSAVKLRIRSRVSRTLGKIYNRNLHTATKARSLPKRPVFPARPKLVRRVRRAR
jgi:hypothetical protein